jgi:hypothetical protein
VRPAVHVTEVVPDAVTAALARDFTLLDGPRGAAGLVTMLTDRVDAALLDPARPQMRVEPN